MEKMDKIQCKYIEDYPDIQKSSIHISSETKKYLDGADQLKLKKFFRPIYIRFIYHFCGNRPTKFNSVCIYF